MTAISCCSPGSEPKLSIVVQTEDSGDVEPSSAVISSGVIGETGCESTTSADAAAAAAAAAA